MGSGSKSDRKEKKNTSSITYPIPKGRTYWCRRHPNMGVPITQPFVLQHSADRILSKPKPFTFFKVGSITQFSAKCSDAD